MPHTRSLLVTFVIALAVAIAFAFTIIGIVAEAVAVVALIALAVSGGNQLRAHARSPRPALRPFADTRAAQLLRPRRYGCVVTAASTTAEMPAHSWTGSRYAESSTWPIATSRFVFAHGFRVRE